MPLSAVRAEMPHGEVQTMLTGYQPTVSQAAPGAPGPAAGYDSAHRLVCRHTPLTLMTVTCRPTPRA